MGSNPIVSTLVGGAEVVPKRGHMSNKRVVWCCVAAVALLALAAPAGAQSVPPGWQDPGAGAGAWAAFTLDSTDLGVVSRSDARWGPVNIVRHTSSDLDVEAAFGNWEVREIAPGVLESGWPSSWSADGRSFERASSWCPAASPSCSYYVLDGGSGQFFAAAGTPLDGLGQPDPGLLLQYQQSISLADPPTMNIVFNRNLSPVKGANGQPGHITLDASGTTDGLPGTLDFAWAVRDTANNAVASATGQVADVDLSKDGTYCISLTVTNPSDGYSQTFDAGCALVSGVAPDRVAPGPGGNPSGGTGGGGGGPAPLPAPPAAGVDPGDVAQSVVFAPPRRSVPPALFGGRNGEAQVVWLWRPEWAGAPTGPRKPRTASPPVVRERDDIVIGASEPTPDSSAAPWLAGLGAFGLFGFGWIITRRRRLRRADL